jgi:hypothetical protein
LSLIQKERKNLVIEEGVVKSMEENAASNTDKSSTFLHLCGDETQAYADMQKMDVACHI